MIDINKNDWKYYLTRRFNLFETSIWHEWYCSDLMEKLVGIKLKYGIYMEYLSGNSRSYRRPEEIDRFIELVSNVAPDRGGAMVILNQAIELNRQAEQLLRKETVLNFKDNLEFLNKIVIYAILPYYIGNARSSDAEISRIVEDLRSVSYYPKILKQIITPQAFEMLSTLGFEDPDLLNVTTIKELFSGKIDSSRLALRKSNNSFVYENMDGNETVSWTNNVKEFIDKIEGDIVNDIAEISGTVAFKGLVAGRVRIIQSGDVEKIIFEKGDILVCANANPSLISLIQKAGAILTDEGGLMSHAAVLARELKIPCIIGTKNATRVLRDGDMVEVDANRGVAIKLK